MGREEVDFDSDCLSFRYVLGVGGAKIKMLWTVRRAFLSGDHLHLWHHWVHGVLS